MDYQEEEFNKEEATGVESKTKDVKATEITKKERKESEKFCEEKNEKFQF